MNFDDAFKLFTQAFTELLAQNYYFQMRLALFFVGMVLVFFVLKLTGRD